jgi:hypothetical protein
MAESASKPDPNKALYIYGSLKKINGSLTNVMQ